MAGAGYKLFNTGDVLTAAQVNTYLQEQTVMVFANSTARTTALSGVLAEGMMSYLQDTNSVEVYNGTSWVNVGNAGDITEVQAGVGISIASGTGPIPVITNSSTDLITTAGDLLYGTAADTVARLGIGTAGQVLKVNSGATAPEWGAVSSSPTGVGCLVLPNGSVSVNDSTDTVVDFDLEVFDTDGFHSTVTNTSRITIPTGKGGKYYVFATTGMNNGSTNGRRELKILKNGAEYSRMIGEVQGSNLTYYFAYWGTMMSLVATDYIQVQLWQNSGGTRSYYGDSSVTKATQFGAIYLGA